MPTLHDQATGSDDTVGTLFTRQPQIFFDPIKRVFARPAIDGENGFVAQQVDRVVTPRSGGDLSPVKIENGRQFMSVEGSTASGIQAEWFGNCRLARMSRAKNYRVGYLVQIGSPVAASIEDRPNVF